LLPLADATAFVCLCSPKEPEAQQARAKTSTLSAPTRSATRATNANAAESSTPSPAPTQPVTATAAANPDVSLSADAAASLAGSAEEVERERDRRLQELSQTVSLAVEAFDAAISLCLAAYSDTSCAAARDTITLAAKGALSCVGVCSPAAAAIHLALYQAAMAHGEMRRVWDAAMVGPANVKAVLVRQAER
jgi:hypothetical protein